MTNLLSYSELRVKFLPDRLCGLALLMQRQQQRAKIELLYKLWPGSDILTRRVGSLVSLWRPGQCRLAVKVGHGGETTYDKNPWRNSGGEAPMAFRRKIDLIGRHGTEQDETDRLPEKEERETIIINVAVIIKLKKIQQLLLLIWLNKTPKVFDWLIRLANSRSEVGTTI